MEPPFVSILRAIIEGLGSQNAANAQRDAAGQAMGVQRDVYNQGRAAQQPYLQAGQATLAQLIQQMQSGGFDVDPAQLANDPGYQFRMEQGQRALERSAAARGGLASGGTLRSLARYSQGVASDELQNAWTRRQGAFNRFATVAGMGQGAANTLGQLGAHYADSMGELYGAQGNATAAGHMGLANAISGGAGRIGGTLGDIFGGIASGELKFPGSMGGGSIPTQQRPMVGDFSGSRGPYRYG